MMKKTPIQILFIAVFLSNCLLLSACAPAEEYPFSPTALEKRFGDTMDEIVEDLGIDLSTAEVEEQSEEQTDITVEDIPLGENQTASGLILSFRNNIFYGVYYVSADAGYIYDQTIAMYALCNEQYGEELTDEYLTEPILGVNYNAKPSEEEFVGSDERSAYVAAWRAKNDKVSKDAWNGEEIRFDITANSITDNGEKWATLGMSFEPLYFDPERMDTGSE